MKNLDEIMKAAQAAQGRLMEAQARMETLSAEGASGGGLVRVTLNGKGALQRLSIDATLMKPEDREIVEDLIVAAHADALARLETVKQAELAKAAQGLGLPPGFKLPF
jgi:nucleoid-associated protein EbfC